MYRIVSSITLIALVSATIAIAEDWNQWRGPDRDGRLADSALPTSLQGNLELQWEHPHSPSYSGPVVAGNLVFTTETIDKTTEKVSAYNLETGELVWAVQWPGSMAVPFFAAANGDWIRSTPACTENHLVVLGMRDVLVCLDPKTGSEIWRNDFTQTTSTPLPSFGAVCSPVIDGEAVYVQNGGALVKVSLKDGSVLWRALNNGEGMMSSGAFSSPLIATIAGQRQLLVQTRQELCGVDMQAGEVLWRQPIEAFRGMNILTPLVVGDAVFTSAHSGRAQMFDLSRDDVGKWQVKERWNQKNQAYMSSPVEIDGLIYLHQKNQRLTALSVADGTASWTGSPQGKYWSMVTDGQHLLGLDDKGNLRLIQPTPSEMKVIDELSVGSDSWAHLAVQGNRIIVRDLKALKVYRWK